MITKLNQLNGYFEKRDARNRISSKRDKWIKRESGEYECEIGFIMVYNTECNNVAVKCVCVEGYFLYRWCLCVNVFIGAVRFVVVCYWCEVFRFSFYNKNFFTMKICVLIFR